MVLVIDNYDSFTYNLVQYLGELGAEVRVRRNDQVTLDEMAEMAPEHIVISPGPGRPEDAGVSVDVIRRFGPTTPMLGVCLGHQAIGDGLRRHRDAGDRADARQDVDRGARRQGRLRRRRRRRSRPGAITRWSIVRRRLARASCEVAARTKEDGTIMARAPRRLPGARRAVPSRVGADRRGPAHPAELPGPVSGRMTEPASVSLTALVEKVVRHEDLTEEEASAAMHEVMEGRAAPAALAGLLTALAMKGERPPEIVGFARTMREHAVKLSAPGRGGLRHLRHGRRSRRHVQHLVGGGPRRGRVRRDAWPSTATGRCRAGAAAPTSSRRWASTWRAPPAVVERTLREAGIAFFFAPTFHPSMKHAGADAPRAWHPHRVQPARSADQPGAGDAADRRRAAPGADRAAGAGAAAARLDARLGRARRRRHRRDLDDRLHEGVGVPGRRGPHVLRAPGRLRRCRRRRRRRSRAAMPRRTPPSSERCSPARPGPRATWCCSTPARRCSSPGAPTSVRDGIRQAAAAIDSRRGRSATLDRMAQLSHAEVPA